MKELSIDPRVNRMTLPEETQKGEQVVDQQDYGITYEVFIQKKKGTQHTHAGIVHASDAETALVFAKEQFTRRGEAINVWVVKSSEVLATSYDDTDIFDPAPDKVHREPGTYKVKEKIKQYKEKKANDSNTES
jgi:ring-1,2-phenylacetyl-CoA epoxidase subunit PaaB